MEGVLWGPRARCPLVPGAGCSQGIPCGTSASSCCIWVMIAVGGTDGRDLSLARPSHDCDRHTDIRGQTLRMGIVLGGTHAIRGCPLSGTGAALEWLAGHTRWAGQFLKECWAEAHSVVARQMGSGRTLPTSTGPSRWKEREHSTYSTSVLRTVSTAPCPSATGSKISQWTTFSYDPDALIFLLFQDQVLL